VHIVVFVQYIIRLQTV